MNELLQGTTFITGPRLTEADMLACSVLSPYLHKLTYQDKESFHNVLRWFNHVSTTLNNPKITRIPFQRNKLYI
ncbi:hypothetical protein Ciccas_008921 [Cichlidogyrus casuarinus]|uniref:Nuclear-export cofactor Arc1-like N-terminal domain-containing protein n=1 Tax=Cichlidogyrus casuarinus TaxID=1844966 RepID=A0ABD2PYR1_9PLAT